MAPWPGESVTTVGRRGLVGLMMTPWPYAFIAAAPATSVETGRAESAIEARRSGGEPRTVPDIQSTT